MKSSRSLSPFRDRDVFSPLRDYQNFFRGFGFPELSSLRDEYEFNPVCEIKEDKNNYLLKLEVPGVAKDDLQIELQDNQLTIRGEKRAEKEQEGEREHFSETYYGSFVRSFTLPGPVQSESIKAKLENGVLKLTLPKDEERISSRQVKIQ